MANPDITVVLLNLFNELIDGPPTEWAWLLNPGDPGLLKSLDKLTAEQASEMAPRRSSIAAHVDHLRYGLELLNRWTRGEEPFADADYSASWKRTTVTEDEWASRRAALRSEAVAWRDALKRPIARNDFELTGVVASVAHMAYHLGAIRQMNDAIRGPLARD